MAIGGEGAYLVSVLWGLTGLVLFFLVLRIYTRVVCLAQYGIDDNFYVFTSVSLSASPPDISWPCLSLSLFLRVPFPLNKH